MLFSTLSRSLGFRNIHEFFRESFTDCVVRRWHRPSLIVRDSLWAVGALIWFAVGSLVVLSLLVLSAFCRTILSARRLLCWTTRPRHAFGLLLIMSLAASSAPAAPQ